MIAFLINDALYIPIHSAGQVRRVRAGDDRSIRLLPQQESWKLSGDKLAFSMAWRHKDHQAADLLVCQLVEIFAQQAVVPVHAVVMVDVQDKVPHLPTGKLPFGLQHKGADALIHLSFPS